MAGGRGAPGRLDPELGPARGGLGERLPGHHVELAPATRSRSRPLLGTRVAAREQASEQDSHSHVFVHERDRVRCVGQLLLRAVKRAIGY